MRTSATILLFHFATCVALGQTYHWGDDIQANTQQHDASIVRLDEDGAFLVVIKDRRTTEIYAYDSALKETGYWDFDIEHGRQRERIRKFRRQGDTLHVLYEQHLSSSMAGVFHSRLSIDGLRIDSMLIGVDHKNGDYPDIHYTRNGSKHYFWYSISDESRKEETRITVTELNDEWIKTGVDTFNLFIPSHLIRIGNIEVERLGKYVVYSKVYEGNRVEKRAGKPNYRYVVSVVEQNDETGFKSVRPYYITSDSFYYRSIRFDRRGADLSFVGLYSEKVGNPLYGIVSGSADLNKVKSVQRKHVKLPDSIIYINGKEEGLQLINPVSADFYIHHYWYNDSVLNLMMEQFQVDLVGSTASTSLYDFYYKNILFLTLDTSSGEFNKLVEFEKFQRTFNDYGKYSSFRSIRHPDGQIHFAYNRQKKLRSMSFLNRMTNPRRSILMYATINPDGKITEKPIHYSRKQKKVIMPSDLMYLGNSRYIGLASWKKKSILVKIDFSTLE